MYHETFDCVPCGFHDGLLLESDRTSDREAEVDPDRTDDPNLERSVRDVRRRTVRPGPGRGR